MVMQSLKKHLQAFVGKKVLVAGDLMSDRYVWGRVSRISPEAPIPVVHVTREESKPGGAANVAVNLKKLGADVLLAGVIGDDAGGRELEQLLLQMGMDTSLLLRDTSRPTIVKTRVIAHQQQIVRVDREDKRPLNVKLQNRLQEQLLAKLAEVDAVLFSDYDKGALSLELCQAVIQRAHDLKKVVTADPKPQNMDFFRGCTIITPNRLEAENAAGLELDSDENVLEAGRRLLDRLNTDAVLITRGEDGMSLFEGEGRISHIPTQALEVFDVTGAGDTVISTLTLALAAGAGFEESALLANTAAGIVVGEIGVAAVDTQQILQVLQADEK